MARPLSMGFMDGDSGVRGDDDGDDDGDKQAALAAQAVVEPLPTVRYPGPPSHTMLPALQQWATHWLQNGIDTASGISAIENMANNNQGAQTCPPSAFGTQGLAGTDCNEPGGGASPCTNR